MVLMLACKKVILPYRVGGEQTTLPIHSDANSCAQMHVSTNAQLCISTSVQMYIFAHHKRTFWHIANVHFLGIRYCFLPLFFASLRC